MRIAIIIVKLCQERNFINSELKIEEVFTYPASRKGCSTKGLFYIYSILREY